MTTKQRAAQQLLVRLMMSMDSPMLDKMRMSIDAVFDKVLRRD
jgi:hypothetical protein